MILAIVVLGACEANNKEGEVQMKSNKNDVQINDSLEKLLEKYEVGNNIVPKYIISDKETAIKVAENILLSIYGDQINDKKPFEVTYDEEFKAWVISATLGKNFNWWCTKYNNSKKRWKSPGCLAYKINRNIIFSYKSYLRVLVGII